MIRTKNVAEDFVDNLEFDGQTESCKYPKGTEVNPPGGEFVDRVLDRERRDLNDRESKEYREFLLLPAAVYYRSQDSHDDRL
jgi:hypothetical protein